MAYFKKEYVDLKQQGLKFHYLLISHMTGSWIFLKFMHNDNNIKYVNLCEDIVKYQKAVIVKPNDPKVIEIDVKNSVHSFFRNAFVGKKSDIKQGNFEIEIESNKKLRPFEATSQPQPPES